MDIFSHLKHEHDQIRSTLEQIESTEDMPQEREELLAALHDDLLTHFRGEEQTFYSELLEHDEFRSMLEGAIREHGDIEELLAELMVISVRDAEWPLRYELLRDAVEAHLEEEESAIFDRARNVFDERDAERLFSRMRTAEEHFRSSI